MGIPVLGPNGEVVRASDYGSLQTSDGPKQGDHFMAGCQTGIIAAGLSADSELLQFRWTNTDYLALIDEIVLSAGNLGTAFAAGGYFIDVTRATGFSAAGTGGAAVTLTSPFGKLDTNQANATRVTEIRRATTAALTAGTKTLDGEWLASIAGGVPNVAGSNMFQNMSVLRNQGHPLVLRANEGWVVRADVPATGTWYLSCNIRWREVLASEYAANG